MKNILRNALLVGIVLLLGNCTEEEVTSRKYPRLKTLPVSGVTSEGVQLNAEIIYRGGYQVIDYGFVWGEEENPTKEGSELVLFSKDLHSNDFSVNIDTSLIEGVTYFVRAFVETSDYMVYGENVSFIRLGSQHSEGFYSSPTEETGQDTSSTIRNNFR